MTKSEVILDLASQKPKITSAQIAKLLKISRQTAASLLRNLVASRQLIKFGSTKNSFYTLPQKAKNFPAAWSHTFPLKNLQEHQVLESLSDFSELLAPLPENIKSIFDYAFSEMLNNAIEHSKSSQVNLIVIRDSDSLIFHIHDFGIGVFRNVMKQRKLKSEIEAIQDILKGKTTTQPHAHSGEGIFFTSKVADIFSLDSFGYELEVNNLLPNVFIRSSRSKKGTSVRFQISLTSKLHLNEIFQDFQPDPDSFSFDKTKILVKLFTSGAVHVSRSQARRILSGLEKFKIIVLDFDQVPNIGQAFADEIFRVWQIAHPQIQIQIKNTNKDVDFMIQRAKITPR